MKFIEAAKAAQIFEDILDAPKRQRADVKRYREDPEYREKILARTRAWNAENKAKKAENDAKWRKKHGAEANRRYRQRKRENGTNNV